MSGSPSSPRPRVVAIVQARMTSSRLPGKVLMPIAGRASILFMCRRLQRARTLDAICVATSLDPSDDQLAACVEAAGLPVFRGAQDDVLARFLGAAQSQAADIVVRLTGDCPLIDPDLVDRVVGLLIDAELDYSSNIAPPTFPDGLDVEAITMNALRAAADEAALPSEREHVTLFLRAQPERFRSGCVTAVADLSKLRWTVDYPDDLDLVRRLVAGVNGDPVQADRFDFLRVHEGLEDDGLPNHARNEGLAASLLKEAGGAAGPGLDRD